LTAEARHTAQLAEATAALTAEIAGLEARLTSAYTNHLRQTLAEATLQIQLPEARLAPALAPAPAPAPGPAIATVAMPDLELDPEPTLVDDFHIPGAENTAPEYRMSRAIKTVEALWQEWMTGLPGQPAVSALDVRWGSQWRAGRRSEVQWYSLRLEVIREIRRVSKSRRCIPWRRTTGSLAGRWMPFVSSSGRAASPVKPANGRRRGLGYRYI
jgi:hypothetical protein